MIDSDEFLRDAIKSRSRVPDYSQKADALLSRMTLEEKVGQMTQLTLEMVVTGHDQNVQIDQAKLQKAINRLIGADNKPIVEPGEFDVMVGGLKERFTLK